MLPLLLSAFVTVPNSPQVIYVDDMVGFDRVRRLQTLASGPLTVPASTVGPLLRMVEEQLVALKAQGDLVDPQEVEATQQIIEKLKAQQKTK
ncbi:hypothetical protein [Limnoglobus roseus]|uniref:Uncharacterized protein n=1 Tax=Limnoglobus roseus TaxID=2598579 RepID=A0A5C1A8B6_9BACT|nr:hypothetical protein [Limnoglobus roseus]QEL14246.1 hypothetical protein PX52LOC_01116 [Limnoglobus roseus]